jgi:conjugal transfer pilus assembly protein TraB
MTDQASEIANGSEQRSRELHEPVSAGQLNERTAKRQRMLLAGIATVILAGTSWIIFGSDHAKKAHAEGEAETIETASLVNRNLSQREFTTVYGNQLGAVTREQKALKEGAVMRPEMEAELAALKAENQAMRTDGQAAIDAISAENTQLKNQLQSQASTPVPNAAAMPAYGPRAS